MFQLSWAGLAITILLITIRLYPHKLTDSKLNLYKSYQTHTKFLPWQLYQNNCHQSAWEQTSIAATELKCADLEGTEVRWDGYISHIRVKSINNNFKTIIDKFPKYFKNNLYCLLGEESPKNCSNLNNDINCYYPKCHLNYWNKYKFEISVKLVSGVWGKTAEIVLIGDNHFRNFTEDLRVNDKVWFRGTLTNEFNIDGDGLIGGLRPHLKLWEIGCSTCSNINLTSCRLDETYFINVNDVFNYMVLVFKCLLNFLFNPIVAFK